MLRSEFEFQLPEELIAQSPAARREDARLLHVGAQLPGGLADLRIPDMVERFAPGDVLVVNDTRVIAARLRGRRESGGRFEMLIERVLGTHEVAAQVRASHAPGPGTRVFVHAGPEGPVGALALASVPEAAEPVAAAREPVTAAQTDAPATPAQKRHAATVTGRERDLFTMRFEDPVDTVLASAGELPLPPYIRHVPDQQDLERYQTVYARVPGAVAAPTAGLHLTEALLGQLRARGVQVVPITLHVGAGTFQPVRCEDVAQHHMHTERFEIPEATAQAVNSARARGARITAVGTTSVRALESAMENGQLRAGPGETALFILPGYRFACVERMLTNFHLPGSTLVMLVSAFAGTERIRAAYRHAIAQRYRFFSYGDAMLLEREAAPTMNTAPNAAR